MIQGQDNKKDTGNSATGNQSGDSNGSAGANTGATGSSQGTSQGSAPAVGGAPAFNEPQVIEAKIDPKQKPAEGPVPFSFTKPAAVHQKYAVPSKGDAARIEEKTVAPDTRSDAEKLAALDADIARDEKSDQPRAYSDYHDTAEMFILGYEATLMFLGRLISKDTSDTAYGFSEKTREKLIYQATKVSRKRNWVMPIEYMFAGTIAPATLGVLLKAKEKRNEYFKNNPGDKAPILNKGGKNKGMVKTRERGRPSV